MSHSSKTSELTCKKGELAMRLTHEYTKEDIQSLLHDDHQQFSELTIHVLLFTAYNARLSANRKSYMN
jgi:hypothetical protein